MDAWEKAKRSMEEEAVKLVASTLLIFEKYRTLNLLHDRLCQEAVRRAEAWMVAQGVGMPPAPYCWFELGSGGRGERTIGNDQDHGLVYSAIDTVQEPFMHHDYFLLFGRRISYELELSGYPLCTGNVIASNERWRHDLDGWKRTIMNWIDDQGLDAIRYLLILCDMRAIYGDRLLYHKLKNWMQQQLYENKVIQRRFAEHSLAHSLPFGPFRTLHYERWGEHAGEYNVKEGGYYQLVNTIRILSIIHKVDAIETKERLGGLYRVGIFSVSEYERWLDVLGHILAVRLGHHVRLYAEGIEPHNYVNIKIWGRAQLMEWKEMLYFLKSQQKYLAGKLSR
ncbi:DUF294 nucleotidyltransferase-like domain-containing protein [Aneurinibacillus sp. REN35]|uniref:DUF294 nucleotidyltransferase-like domain-containing protein n=1 Tax=Aneurinibacillus sp. REN35 TaxID=3237286 RepID=UPI0035282CFA